MRATPIDAGEEHDRALDFLISRERSTPEHENIKEWNRLKRMLEGYGVQQRGFSPSTTTRVLREATAAMRAAGVVHDSGGGEYLRLGANGDVQPLLAMADELARRGVITRRLASELRRVQRGAARSDSQEGLLALVHGLAQQRWSGNDRLAVQAFVDVAEHSAAYWSPRQEVGRPARRIRIWVTILADALGGALGGAVGAAAGGPLGAGIGAGLLGASASYVFSSRN